MLSEWMGFEDGASLPILEIMFRQRLARYQRVEVNVPNHYSQDQTT